ncbi:hypothetical protein QJQ45_011470 [Haematococcus lacustris]|nr:hypothetical protein QJQ45_011470 [Haematococcus lacustris]
MALTDVWLLSVVKDAVLLGCVLAAPAVGRKGRGAPNPANHAQLAILITGSASLFETFVMVKAALVAMGAPDEVWPPARDPSSPPSPSGAAPFPGLLYMFTSLGVSLLGSLVESWAAGRAIAAAKAGYESSGKAAGAAAEQDGLHTPLLAAEAPASTAEKGGAKASQESQAAARKEADKKQAPVSSKTVGHLLRLSAPDWHIIALAFLAGCLAALAQACIPYFTGLVIDYASIEPDRDKFLTTIKRLVAVAVLCGLLTGSRGGLFTVVMSKLNVRIRKRLFKSLLACHVLLSYAKRTPHPCDAEARNHWEFLTAKSLVLRMSLGPWQRWVRPQAEVGFYDTTKTGEITSRLSADTSTVSDSVCLNLNVMLRSIAQAAMVLAFMFTASWRLTVVYGRYFASLAKRVQAELAEANSVADEVLSSMTTVKAHAAQDSAEADYAVKLDKFFALLIKEAVAYALYMVLNTFLPNAVAALVLLYGGHLVLDGKMSPGSLVSFMLYQGSLSSAFQALGDVFSALTGAVGAADKVLELMHRAPLVGAGGSLVPAQFEGRIELRDVHFAYPARPHAKVLSGLSLTVAPGEVVALVGPSGGGKSSIVKLVERFYLPQVPGHGLLTHAPHPRPWTTFIPTHLTPDPDRCLPLVSTHPPTHAHKHRSSLTPSRSMPMQCLALVTAAAAAAAAAGLLNLLFLPLLLPLELLLLLLLLSLLFGLLRAQSGEVLLDGQDVGRYHPKWLRRNVALVSQEPTLYARSIRRNILYGLEPQDGMAADQVPSQEEVEEACRQANAHDFILAFPDGYETNCGEKGVQMSGGQKQRLAIARALVRKPRVLLLDEATSALDADSEAVVQEALDRVMSQRTVLVIAHRLSTVQHADRIVVIARGAVQEMGTHEELLRRSGAYASLVRRQLQRPDSLVSLVHAASTVALESSRQRDTSASSVSSGDVADAAPGNSLSKRSGAKHEAADGDRSSSLHSCTSGDEPQGSA